MYKFKLSSKITIIGLCLLLIFFGDLKFKQYQNQRQIEQQRQSLQKQADDLQKKNNDLTQSLQYLNSDSFKERVARQQLGLKRTGEQVYAFTNAPAPAPADSNTQSSGGNLKKWWDYFFGN